MPEQSQETAERMGVGDDPGRAEHDAESGSETSERLIGLMKLGDRQAAERLVLRFHEPLTRYLMRLSGSMLLAEELHQQTWLSVIEHADKFDPTKPGGFKAWLFRIATNKVNDLWRARGRQKVAYDGVRNITERSAPDAAERLEATEADIRLRAAIARLPEAQRQVLMMRYYSGLKFVEIADTLGCPLNTALGRMHKAMIRLKELMTIDL